MEDKFDKIDRLLFVLEDKDSRVESEAKLEEYPLIPRLICMAGDAEVVFLCCGHLTTGLECARAVEKRAMFFMQAKSMSSAQAKDFMLVSNFLLKLLNCVFLGVLLKKQF